jgi:hypothetical protein
MVHEEWLNEGDCVISESVLMWKVKYIEYIKKKYPLIHKEVTKNIEEM